MTWIMGLEVGVFLLMLFAGDAARLSLRGWLELTPDALLHGHVWKLATTALISASGAAFLFDMLVLWLFVPVIEGHWGTRRFLIFTAMATLVGNLASVGMGLLLGGVARETPIVGISPLVFASIAAYGTMFADQPVQLFGVLPLKGRTLALGTAAFALISVLVNRAWVDAAGFFAAMIAGWLFAGGRLDPRLWVLRLRRWRLRRRVTILDGGAPISTTSWARKPPPGVNVRPPGGKGKANDKEWLN